MHSAKLCFLLLSIPSILSAAGDTPVTFSQGNLAAVVQSTCGTAPAGPVHAHRNSAGSMVYLVTEGQSVAYLYSSSQQCVPVPKTCLDFWAADQGGKSVGQVAKHYGQNRLVLGENDQDGLSGKSFDIERGGQYLLISQGNICTISALDKPYRRLVEIPIDGKRLFARKGGFLVVGNNPSTGLLEARPVSNVEGTLQVGGAIALGNLPAGVRVLDYSETRDELLVGGKGTDGQPVVALASCSTGEVTSVPGAQPGDNDGLFLRESALAGKLNGRGFGGGFGFTGKSGGTSEKGGFLGIFKKKN